MFRSITHFLPGSMGEGIGKVEIIRLDRGREHPFSVEIFCQNEKKIVGTLLELPDDENFF